MWIGIAFTEALAFIGIADRLHLRLLDAVIGSDA